MAKALFRFNTNAFGGNIRQLLMSQPVRTKRAMDAVGGYLNGEVKKRTPIDEGFLTADVTNKTFQYEKSFAAILYIPWNAPSAKYAIPMHEHNYNLGEKSQQKQRKVGVSVGRKYITRALWDNLKTIKEIIISEVKL